MHETAAQSRLPSCRRKCVMRSGSLCRFFLAVFLTEWVAQAATEGVMTHGYEKDVSV